MKQDMLYAYTVYSEGSFSKAAEKLFVTQPTLSIAIKRVEQSLGEPLFNREQTPLQLTDAGKLYMQAAKKILDTERDLANQIQDLSTLTSGVLRVGGTHYINTSFLAVALSMFSSSHPNVRIELQEGSSDVVQKMLLNNEIDMMFKVGSADKSLFSTKKVLSDEILLAIPKEFAINLELRPYLLTADMVCSNCHKKEDFPCVPLKAVEQMEFLLLKKNNNLRSRSEKICAENGFQPRIKMELDQMVTIYALTNAGMGVSFISDRLVKSHAFDLCYYKINSVEAVRRFPAVMCKNRYLPKAAREFLRVMEDIYALE